MLLWIKLGAKGKNNIEEPQGTAVSYSYSSSGNVRV